MRVLPPPPPSLCYVATTASKAARQSQAQVTPEVHSEMIAQRDEQMQQIESTMLEVNDIYRDLANLVHEQGDMLDSIEGNMVRTIVRKGGQVHFKLTLALRWLGHDRRTG